MDNLQLAFDLLDHELGISPVIKATELADITKVPDKLTMMSYLSQVYDCFRREIPNVQHSMEGNDITVWKFQDFSVIQILREINFGECRSTTVLPLLPLLGL